MVQTIGIFAGLGTTFSFLPQVFKIFRHKIYDGLSSHMLFIHFSGISCWIIYGIMVHDNILIIFNIITLLLLCLIISKYVYLNYQSTKISSDDNSLNQIP